jgi:hypothetical protein
MNSIRYIVLSIAILCIFSTTIFAQDKIVRRNSDTISCKVIKIGSEVITYKLADPGLTVEFEIALTKVEKIIFENGTEYGIDYLEKARESTESNSADLFLVQRKKTIEWNFTALFEGVTELGYEKALKPGQSYELNLAIIGLGFNIMSDFTADKNPFGIGFKAGYKFMRSPDFYLSKMRYSHILKGSYVNPEIAFAAYGGGTTSDWDGNEMSISDIKGAFLLTFGKQIVYSDRFLVDSYCSMGFGFRTSNDLEYGFTSYYFFVGEGGFPLAFTWGVRIGLLL